MTDKATANREAVRRHEQRQRDAGLVQRKIWAHPDDWPRIRKYVARLNRGRKP